MLEDVERTCDAVVLLREGRVASAGRIDVLEGEAEARLVVRVIGDLARFQRELAARSLTAVPSDGAVLVDGTSDEVLDAVRDAAAAAEVSVRELRPATRTLEDAVIGAME